MAARVLTLIVFTILVVAALLLTRLYGRQRRRRLQEVPQDRLWSALGTRPDGRATIVAFSSPVGDDRELQARELEPLIAQDVRILEVDATTEVDVARTFGIFTLPSTAVLAADGRLLGINRRLAPHQVLQAQLGLQETSAG